MGPKRPFAPLVVELATGHGRFFFYHGESMRGTFRPGDRLTVEPVSLSDLRAGDVVVFHGVNCREDADTIVHRVVAVRADGLVTRGDNSSTADLYPLTEERLVGRVVKVERGGRSWNVHNGRAGLCRAYALRLLRSAVALLGLIGRWPYRGLRASGLARRFWQPAITRVYLQTERGPLVKYVCAGRTVACWRPTERRFECRKPYDLVIDRLLALRVDRDENN